MIQTAFSKLKKTSIQLRSEALSETLHKLQTLERVIIEFQEQIIEALIKDFGKPRAESLMTEIHPVLKEIQVAKKQLKKWRQPEKVMTPLTLLGNKSYIIREPRGVCLIVSPWNYPFNLSLAPIVAAIAARNSILLKPSEYTPNTNRVITEILVRVFSEDQVKVIEAGVDGTQDILKFPFDHIFFTGSTAVGKIIMKAASQNLSSLTLELGGKSPTIVDADCDIESAAEKIVWAKFVNAGQTCVAPDYVLVHSARSEEFISFVRSKINSFYKNEADLCSIISQQHSERLQNLVTDAVGKGAKPLDGLSIGSHNVGNQKFMPTVLENVSMDSEIMRQEIFGPILPILKFDKIDEAIHSINGSGKPLALYIYTNNHENLKRLLMETSSGGICHNNSLVHLGNSALPFGGVGSSGFGSYHGYFGFKAFSHEKAFLKEILPLGILKNIFPPYTEAKLKIIRLLVKWF